VNDLSFLASPQRVFPIDEKPVESVVLGHWRRPRALLEQRIYNTRSQTISFVCSPESVMPNWMLWLTRRFTTLSASHRSPNFQLRAVAANVLIAKRFPFISATN
jgi:hypothetical protein